MQEDGESESLLPYGASLVFATIGIIVLIGLTVLLNFRIFQGSTDAEDAVWESQLVAAVVGIVGVLAGFISLWRPSTATLRVAWSGFFVASLLGVSLLFELVSRLWAVPIPMAPDGIIGAAILVVLSLWATINALFSTRRESQQLNPLLR
jgi:hypothetical protein